MGDLLGIMAKQTVLEAYYKYYIVLQVGFAIAETHYSLR
jgi:hypothetical protein